MIIYTNRISLHKEIGIDKVLSETSSWINYKTNKPTSSLYKPGYNTTVEMFKTTGDHDVVNYAKSRLYTCVTISSFPYLYGVRFTHGDQNTAGRLWITEIGLRIDSEGGNIEYSLVLSVRDISTQANAPVVTRPHIDIKISKLAKQKTDKLVIDRNNADAYLQYIENKHRTKPILLVSSRMDGLYFVDLRKLEFALSGIIDIGIISEEDSFAVERAIGKYAVWRGGINIVSPGIPSIYEDKQFFFPYRKLKPDSLEILRKDSIQVENYILAIIAHYSNFKNINDHISCEYIKEISLKRKILERKEGTKECTIESLKDEISLQNEYINTLELDNNNLREQASELSKLKYENESLKHHMNNITQVSTAQDLHEINLYPKTLEEIIKTVRLLFQDRIDFTSRAYDSASDYSEFTNMNKAWLMLRAIAVVLYDLVFYDKVADIEKEFRNKTGIDLSMSEGKQTKKDAKLMSLRKDSYSYKTNDGREEKQIEIDIVPHIGWGTKEPDLLRIHFFILRDEALSRIVIGHCGRHLDNYTTKSKKF